MKYLFRAYFADGTVIAQTDEDRSLLAEGRSAYTDVVLLQAAGKELTLFALCLDGEPVAAVHLDDGHFELGGNEFWIGDNQSGARELVYYRQVKRNREMDIDSATLEELGEWREWTETRFVIGWEADGVQHTIGLDDA